MVYTMDKQKCFSKMDLPQFMTDYYLIEKPFIENPLPMC